MSFDFYTQISEFFPRELSISSVIFYVIVFYILIFICLEIYGKIYGVNLIKCNAPKCMEKDADTNLDLDLDEDETFSNDII